MGEYFGFLDAQVEQIFSGSHDKVSDRSLFRQLWTQTQHANVTLRSVVQIAVAWRLISSLGRSIMDQMFTAFIYGSTARGESNGHRTRFLERRLYLGGQFIGSLFRKSPLYSDLDIAILSGDVEETQKKIALRITNCDFEGDYPLERPVLWGIKVFPTDDVIEIVKASSVSLVRRIITLSPLICLHARSHLNYLAGLARSHCNKADEQFLRGKKRLDRIVAALIEKYQVVFLDYALLGLYAPVLYPNGQPASTHPDELIASRVRFPQRPSTREDLTLHSKQELSDFLYRVKARSISEEDIHELSRPSGGHNGRE